MSTLNESILYLFVRPTEPVNIPKTVGKTKFVFKVEDPQYLRKRFRDENRKPFMLRSLSSDADCEEIMVKKLSNIPDLSIPLQLKRSQPFSLFIPQHNKIAAKLIEILLGMETYDELLSVAVYCKNRINCAMFVYALSVTIAHRSDTKHLSIPSLVGIFPNKFVDRIALGKAYEEANTFEPEKRKCIEIKPEHTASDLEVEHRVAYFREDLGINLHHWYWHVIYPFEGTMDVVHKDRRGELFYYMHQQIVARYNFERLSNNLGLAKSFSDFRQPISEGYFSKLGSDMGNGAWPGRHSGAVLKDVNRTNREFDIQQLDRSTDRIIEAIHLGFVTSVDGKKIKLDEFNGIDIVGDTVQATILSPNRILYGNLHNNGHIAIGSCHDPDFRHLEGFGVMGEDATAMRDPIFYRWHTFINDIFVEHKNLLPPYTAEQLDYEGVIVNNINIEINTRPSKSFGTFWQQSDVDISNGLNFAGNGNVHVRFTHLNNTRFTYNINVTNESGDKKIGTFRIFMAPKLDERGHPFTLNKQRHLMIELDKFAETLNPGSNVIKRQSADSSITIPYERTFPKLDETNPFNNRSRDNYCGCGWPQHMLIPKGTKDGLPIDLFVMVSDSAIDKINDIEKTCCKNAFSFCGLKDKKYPDARAMGYPFDRRPRDEIPTLEKFLTKNMKFAEMSIVFNDHILQPDGRLVPEHSAPKF